MEDQKHKSGVSGGAFALGLIAGAIAGILFAPKPGKEMREDLKNTLGKIKDEVADKLSRVKDISEDTYRNIVTGVVEKYQQTKELTEEEAGEIKSELDKGYREIKKVTSDNDSTDEEGA